MSSVHEPKLIILGLTSCEAESCARGLLWEGFTGVVLTGQYSPEDELASLKLKATTHYPTAQYLVVLAGISGSSGYTKYTAVDLISGYSKTNTERAGYFALRGLEAIGYVRPAPREYPLPDSASSLPFAHASISYRENLPLPPTPAAPKEDKITIDLGSCQLVMDETRAQELRNHLARQLFDRARTQAKQTEEEGAAEHERELRANGAIETTAGLLYFSKSTCCWRIYTQALGDRRAPPDLDLPQIVWARPASLPAVHAYSRLDRTVCGNPLAAPMAGPRIIALEHVNVCGACLLKTNRLVLEEAQNG